MRVLLPTEVTDDVLVSSSIAEDDAPAYASGTTYAVGDRVMIASLHRVYESLQASNTGHYPSISSSWWVDVGPTNRWAMFKGTDGLSSSAASSIVIELDVGSVDDVALVGLEAESITVTGTGVSVSKVIPAPAPPATSVDLHLGDLAFAGGTLTITIESSGTVVVRHLAVGNFVDIGEAQHGLTIGINDYSVKAVDEFGNVSVSRRGYSRRVSTRVVVDPAVFDHVAQVLASVRAMACVWEVAARHAALTVFGYYTDWALELTNPTAAIYSISLESLALNNLEVLPGSAIGGAALLLESGAYLLLESGGHLLLEA